MPHLHDSELEHVRTFGWIRVHGAFSTDAAAAMREVIWGALGQVGILREDPASWTKT